MIGMKKDPRFQNHSLSRRIALLVVLGSFAGMSLLAQVAWGQTATAGKSAAGERLPAIQASELKHDVNFLAGPAMRGRGNGTKELHKAAKYIAGEFRRAGLEPLGDPFDKLRVALRDSKGDRKSYFQSFLVTVGAKLTGKNFLEARRNGSMDKLAISRDYLPLSFSESGSFRGELVFAGYGITAPEFHYDDYAGIEAKDKIVIVMRHEPQEDDEKSVFQGKDLTSYSLLVNKIINARNHGARALILVNDPLPHQKEEDLLMRFGSVVGPENVGLPVVQVKQAVVERWLAASGKKLTELEATIDKELKPQSFALGPAQQVEMSIHIKRIVRPDANVIGVLRGNDPKLAQEAIIIGAHYDHLGLGDQHSLAPDQVGKIHAGADDNASGTSAVLELARAFAPERMKLRRSLVFVTFAGEELGLLGSTYYTKHPAWPIEQTVAMINMDMIGRVRNNKLYVGGVGTSPVFRDILDKANGNLKFDIAYSTGGYGASDHTSFTTKQIPTLFFFSGLHSDYHKPSDTPEKIDAGSEAKVAELVASVALALDNLEARPSYVRVQEAAPVAAGGGGGYGPYFGSIPDFEEIPHGVRFADVRAGSPAEKAGLKPGDILTEFDGQPVKNLYDFTYALRRHKVGEVVHVKVLRGSQTIEADVTLAQRK